MASLKKLDLTNDSKRNEVLLKDRVKEVNEGTCIDQILTMYQELNYVNLRQQAQNENCLKSLDRYDFFYTMKHVYYSLEFTDDL